MDTVYLYILLILITIGYLYYKKTENLEKIPKDRLGGRREVVVVYTEL